MRDKGERLSQCSGLLLTSAILSFRLRLFKSKTSPGKLNNPTHFSYSFKVLNCLITRLSEPFAKIDYEILNWSGAMELNHILRPGRPLCYRYTNSAYKRVRLPLGMNSLWKDYFVPFVSTIFWMVSVQCRLVVLTTHRVTDYSVITPFLLPCRADSHLRC